MKVFPIGPSTMFKFANMVVVKLTHDCNFRCKYCYIKNKDDFKGEMMSFAVFKKFIDRLVYDKSHVFKDERKTKVSIVFHGGEPLLAGYTRLSKMLEYAKRQLTAHDIPFDFGLQTNLSLITDELLLLMHNYNVYIGASFDGINKGNIARSKISEDYFIQQIKKAQKYNVEIGVLIVVSKYNIDTVLQTKKFLEERVGINGVKINYVEDVNQAGQSDFEVTGDEYFSKVVHPLLEEVFEKGFEVEDNISLMLKRYFTYILADKHGNRYYNCSGKICGAGLHVVNLSPDGNIYLCGRYSEDYEEAKIMSINDSNPFSAKQIKKYIDFAYKKHEILKEECDMCFAQPICDFGCMAFHFSKYHKWGIRKELVCPIYKNTFKWLVENEIKIIDSFKKIYEVPFKIDTAYPVYSIKDSTFLRKIHQLLSLTVELKDNKQFIFKKAN